MPNMATIGKKMKDECYYIQKLIFKYVCLTMTFDSKEVALWARGGSGR